MLKALVLYSAIVAVLVVAMIASRQNAPKLVKHRSIHQRRLTSDDTE